MQTIAAGVPFDATPDGADRIAAVHTRSVDALAGYVRMSEHAEPQFKDVVDRFRTLHMRQIEVLSSHLVALGRELDESGSFMSTVNETVVSVRAFFTGIDAGAMNGIRSGERSIVESYDEAIETAPTPAIATSLRSLRDEIEHILSETADLG